MNVAFEEAFMPSSALPQQGKQQQQQQQDGADTCMDEAFALRVIVKTLLILKGGKASVRTGVRSEDRMNGGGVNVRTDTSNRH